MVDNRELAARIALLEQAVAEGTDTYQDLIGSNKNLTETQKLVNRTARDNVQGIRDLATSLMQTNRVSSKLSESVKRADRINTKALGSNITLQKVINANSTAINSSNIGYLRAAEAFITNFEGGVRKTSGGTLALTEQLIRTGQSTDGMISMNRNLLGVTGRNYDALSMVNNAVLESSDTYTVSTGKLIDSLSKLQGNINKFSMFGPDVAANISTQMADVLGKFRGLNEDSMGSFFSLLEPSLDKMGTREMFGISDFAQQFARGEATSQQIEATMQSVGQQIQSVTAGVDDYAVAAELVQRQFRVSQDQAIQLVNISRTLAAGPDDAKNLQSTQEEQLETLTNQKEAADQFYQKTAPAALAATVALYAPAIQTFQAINALSMVLGRGSGQGEGGGGLLDQIKEGMGGGKKSPKPTGGKINPATGTLIKNENSVKAQTAVNKKGFGKITDSLKGLKTEFKSGFSNMKGGLKSLFKGGGKPGIGNAALMLAGGLGVDTLADKFLGEGTTGKLAGGVSTGMNIAGMGKMLGFASKGATPMAIAGSLAAEGVGMLTEALGAEQGGTGDTIGDIAAAGLQGAAYGAILGPVGAAVGGGIGLLYGGISEWLDWDGDRAEMEKKTKEAVERQERELRMAREAERARMAKSDTALMSIVSRVTSQQADYMRTASAEQVAKLTEVVNELKMSRSENAQREAGRKSKDLNS